MLLADLAELGLLTWDRADDTIEAGHRNATKNLAADEGKLKKLLLS